MARTILTLLFTISLIQIAQADFFGFGGGKDKFESQIPALIEKIKTLKMSAEPVFEDEFNKSIQALENKVEEEKLFCAGEAQDVKGRTLPLAQKQLCFRDLKKNYLEAVEVVFEAKKKYLGILHNRQLERLSDIQKQQEAEIEKSF
jgi:hypothetical protein